MNMVEMVFSLLSFFSLYLIPLFLFLLHLFFPSLFLSSSFLLFFFSSSFSFLLFYKFFLEKKKITSKEFTLNKDMEEFFLFEKSIQKYEV